MKKIILRNDPRGCYVIPQLRRAGVLALFTGRQNDFSLPQSRERRRLAQSLGIPPQRLVGVRQVHGAKVAVVKKIPAGANGNMPLLIPEQDALITNLSGVALSVLTADCLPVILVDGCTKAIGIAHCGWRGLAAGILRRTVIAMKRSYGSHPKDINAYIGPGIRACCYRVGPEMRSRFKTAMRKQGGGWSLDLVAVAVGQLTRDGLSLERIGDTQKCSFCGKNFFSFRGGDNKARMLSLVMRLGG